MNKSIEDEVGDITSSLPPVVVKFGQAVSICSFFAEKELISATKEQIAKGMFDRFFNNVPLEQIDEVVNDVMSFAIDNGFIDLLNGEYTPTDVGWTIGKDWWNRMNSDEPLTDLSF